MLTLEDLTDTQLLFPSTDEFGGYSSRLRLTENVYSSTSTATIYNENKFEEISLE